MAKNSNSFGDFGADSVSDGVVKGRTAPKPVTGKNGGMNTYVKNGVVQPCPVNDATPQTTDDRPVDLGAAAPTNKGDFSNVVTSGGGSFGQGRPAIRVDSDGDFDDNA